MRLLKVLLAVTIFTFFVSISDAFNAPKKKGPPFVKHPVKPPVKAKTVPPVVQQDSALVHELHGVFQLIDQTAVRYGGHRNNALKEIKLAIANLETEMHKHGQKPLTHKYNGPQSDAAAHAYLYFARRQLGTVAGHLSRMAKSPLRGNASNHINTAIQELNHALALATDLAIVHQLQFAFELLNKADPIYAGHKANAMKEINAAIGDLEKELNQRGLKGHNHAQPPMSIYFSNLEVQYVHSNLVAQRKTLSTLPRSGWRTSSSGHLKTAIDELDKALKIARDHIYVGQLRAIYKLLDKGDPIYKGHRDQAMQQINHAIGNLEKEMALHGLKVHHHPHAWEPEDISHWQVKRAHHALKWVKTSLALHAASPNRKKADGHLHTAITELASAVKVSNESQK